MFLGSVIWCFEHETWEHCTSHDIVQLNNKISFPHAKTRPIGFSRIFSTSISTTAISICRSGPKKIGLNDNRRFRKQEAGGL